MNYKTRLVSTISQLVEELDVFNGVVMTYSWIYSWAKRFLRHNKIEKWCNKYKKAKNLLSRSIKKWVTKLRVVLGLCRHNFIMVVPQSRDSIIKALKGGQEEKETAKRKSHESNLKISLMWRYFIQFASDYFADYNDVSAFERAPADGKNLQARRKQSVPFLESYLEIVFINCL